MKALVKRERAPGIWLEEIEEPALGPNDLRIRIHKTAICGTDIHIYNWDEWAQRTIPVPMAVGHEYAGQVLEVGSEVQGYAVGDRVSGEGHLVCGQCRNCLAGRRHLCIHSVGVGVNRPGAFAEQLVLPASNAFKLPAEIPDEVGAILDPLGNAVHTALSWDLVGEDVLITGAGPIGCMCAAIARQVGARHVVITDLNEYRLGLARRLGATRTLNPAEQELRESMDQLGMTEGFDIGLECSGSAAGFRQMLGAMNNGGRISLLGIPPNDTAIDWDQVIFKGLVLKGIYGREMYETWYKMKTMLQSGLQVTPIITHRFPVAKYQQAFDTMRSGQSGKVLLDWT
jgi:threonine 3-dehydrogenase